MAWDAPFTSSTRHCEDDRHYCTKDSPVEATESLGRCEWRKLQRSSERRVTRDWPSGSEPRVSSSAPSGGDGALPRESKTRNGTVLSVSADVFARVSATVREGAALFMLGAILKCARCGPQSEVR
jgi:hypothetical protein